MKPQLSLFGAEAPSPLHPHVDDHARAVAERVPSWLRLGTSSWTFPGWKGLVYEGAPTQADLVDRGLGAYAKHPLFRVAGIDRSHYGPLTTDDLAKYASQLPPRYLTVSKVWDELTTHTFPSHARWGARAGMVNPRFLDPAGVLAEVLAPYETTFADHAGPFVFEIAPTAQLLDAGEFAERVDRMLAALPKRFGYAFELRNAHLMTPRYFEVLKAHGAGHVFNAWAHVPSIREQLAIPGARDLAFAVSRLSLPPAGRYDELKAEYAPFNRIVRAQPAIRDDVLKLAQAYAGRDVFVLVNNKAEGSAPLTVLALSEMLAKALGTAG